MPNPAEWAVENPDQALIELDRIDCKKFITFVKLAWSQIEPASPFVTGWTVEAMADHLEAISRGEIRRLLMNVPPGFTKSMLCNVFFPAYEWGPLGQPALRYISAAYDKALPIRDLVRCRDLIKSEWYQERWPLEFKQDSDGKEMYANTHTGWRYAASVGSGLTGWRGDRQIIDDPHSVKTAESEAERKEALRWFTETLPTRYNRQNESAQIVVMQRLHEQDISGHILQEMSKDYTTLILPMEYEPNRHCKTTVLMSDGKPFQDKRTVDGELLWPERFNREAVDELKRALMSKEGRYAVAGQLQQDPIPRGGAMFKRADFYILDSLPPGGRRCRGWDLAATEDNPRAAWSVGLHLVWLPDNRLVITDVCRLQGEDFAVLEAIKSCARMDGHGVPISIPQDPGQAGKMQKGFFARELHGYMFHFSPETGSKENRARPLAAQAEAGNVYLLRGEWNAAFISEAEKFPNGTFKDQVDAWSRAYGYLTTHMENDLPAAPILFDLS